MSSREEIPARAGQYPVLCETSEKLVPTKGVDQLKKGVWGSNESTDKIGIPF